MGSLLLHRSVRAVSFVAAVVFFFFFFLVCPELTTSYELLGANLVRRSRQISLPNVTGPESIAFDCRGRGPYVGVSDGRILKWRGARRGWSEYTVTSPTRNRKLCDRSTNPKMEHVCGRPLGLKFDNRTCELYIADAYYGLLRARRGGGAAERVAPGYLGSPFKLTNALDIDAVTGEVYFTDSSQFYQRRQIVLAIMQGDKSGRVMKYNPRTGKVTVLLSGLSFPNGIALSKDSSFLVIAETGKVQLLKFWIRGPRAGTTEVFAQLARYPDNIKRNQEGEFWLALNSGRGDLEREIDSAEEDDIPWFTKDPVAIKYDSDGQAVEILDGKFEEMFASISEVAEFYETLWIGSIQMPYVVKFRL